MWLQRVALGTPIADLWVNPVAWFGSFGALAVTIGLAIVSLIFGYPYVMKLIPGKVKEDEPASESTVEEDEEDDVEEETKEEEIAEEVESAEEEEVVESDSEDEADETDE
jgi:hypothetical protein